MTMSPTDKLKLLDPRLQKYLTKQIRHAVGERTPQLSPAQLQASATSTLLAQLELPLANVVAQIPELAPIAVPSGRLEKHQVTIEHLNDQQKLSVTTAQQGKSFVLIGSAGSGKTTTQRCTIQALYDSGLIPELPTEFSHATLVAGSPAIAVVSFVNKAVNNIRKALPQAFKLNALTLHKLLEYAPVMEEYIEVDKEGNSFTAERKVFRPRRNATNPITHIRYFVVEEASTINLQLWNELVAALPNIEDCTFIFLGDLNQLPPVFGQSILAQKIQELPVVELTQIYRTAEDSPIKKLAIAINEGKPFSDLQLREQFAKVGELELVNLSGKRPDGTFIPRKSAVALAKKLAVQYTKYLQSGEFQVFRDIILCPFRKESETNAINCTYINRYMANEAGKARKAVVWEIRSGFLLHYIAIGDPVILSKREYLVTNIRKNPQYSGMPTRTESETLDRWGHYSDGDAVVWGEMGTKDVLDYALVQLTKTKEESEERKQTTSHIITLIPANSEDTGESDMAEIEITAPGDLNELEFAYATTVHKAIGSEWDRVYLCTHHSMLTMLSRELLYTAVTRAKSFLQIMYDGQNWATGGAVDSSILAKAIVSPRIKGVTLAEKLAWLKQEAAKEVRKTESTSNLLSKY